MKKVIVVGAGPISDDSFLKDKKDCFLVACDGGYKHFINQKMKADLFVGDFDTLDISTKLFCDDVVKLNVIKDDTDTIFAIKKCLEKGYDTFYFYGCLGGKIEHSIANIQTLSFLLDHNAKGYLIDENNDNVLTMISDAISFSTNSKGMISVFAYGQEAYGVTIENLMYTLKDATLSTSFPLGVSNQFLDGKCGKIIVKEGKLIIVTKKENYDDAFFL